MMRWFVAAVICVVLLFAANDGSAESRTPPSPEPFPYMVSFDPESAELNELAGLTLRQILADYRAFKPTIVRVNGYYDRSLSEAAALLLSKQMAEVVRDHLVAGGVPADAIIVAWYGEERPVVQTEDGVAEPANRTVDILFDGAKSRLRP